MQRERSNRHKKYFFTFYIFLIFWKRISCNISIQIHTKR